MKKVSEQSPKTIADITITPEQAFFEIITWLKISDRNHPDFYYSLETHEDIENVEKIFLATSMLGFKYCIRWPKSDDSPCVFYQTEKPFEQYIYGWAIFVLDTKLMFSKGNYWGRMFDFKNEI
jgi:hypothetical protein